MKLRDVLHTYRNVPQMRIAIREFRNRILHEAKQPQSGAYWWLPYPDGRRWQMEVFYDAEYGGNTMHSRMWHKYVVDTLAVAWGKNADRLRRQIGDNYAGLPRGRVNKVATGYSIVHGNDAPTGTNGTDGVLNAFNLRAYQTANPTGIHIMYDDHERMLPGDPERVQSALGVDLGLRASAIALDDEDYYDDDDYDDDDYDDDDYDDDEYYEDEGDHA